MVRFSDMLGGNGDPERPRPIAAPDPALSDEIPEPETEPERDEPETDNARTGLEPDGEADVTGALQSPEDVLDRLTQYATSARASDFDAVRDPGPPEVRTSDPAPGAPDELAVVGDDLLPHAKADTRKRRRK
jgi:hypothetical protein